MKNEKKKEFISPNLNVSRFDEDDVIVTSYGNPSEKEEQHTCWWEV